MSAVPLTTAETFVSRLQALVGILQEAARYGPTPQSERRYAELRQWLRTAYPEVRSVIKVELADSEPVGRTFQDFPGQAPTDLERLVAAPTLDAWVRSREATPTLRLEPTGKNAEQLATLS